MVISHADSSGDDIPQDKLIYARRVVAHAAFLMDNLDAIATRTDIPQVWTVCALGKQAIRQTLLDYLAQLKES